MAKATWKSDRKRWYWLRLLEKLYFLIENKITSAVKKSDFALFYRQFFLILSSYKIKIRISPLFIACSQAAEPAFYDEFDDLSNWIINVVPESGVLTHKTISTNILLIPTGFSLLLFLSVFIQMIGSKALKKFFFNFFHIHSVLHIGKKF